MFPYYRRRIKNQFAIALALINPEILLLGGSLASFDFKKEVEVAYPI